MRSAMTSRSNCAAGEPAVIITRAQAHPAFVALTVVIKASQASPGAAAPAARRIAAK